MNTREQRDLYAQLKRILVIAVTTLLPITMAACASVEQSEASERMEARDDSYNR